MHSRDVEFEVAEAMRRGGWRVNGQVAGHHGCDIMASRGTTRVGVEVRSINLTKSRTAEIFHSPNSSMTTRIAECEAWGAEFVVIGVAHEGTAIVAAGALRGEEFESQVAAVRARRHPVRVLRPIDISSMDRVDMVLPGVKLPGPGSIARWGKSAA